MVFQIGKKFEIRISKWMQLMLVTSVIWAIPRAIGFITSKMQAGILLENFQWIGISIFSPAFFLYSHTLFNNKKLSQKYILTLLVLIPLISLLMIFTNPLHNIFISDYSMVQRNGLFILQKEINILYWIIAGYNFVLITFATARYITKSLRSKGILWFKGILKQLQSNRSKTVSGLTPAQNDYFDLFENAHDAIIISDIKTGAIIGSNKRASEMFGCSEIEFKEKKLDAIISDRNKLSKLLENIEKPQINEGIELEQYSHENQCPISTQVTASIVIIDGKPAVQSVHRDITLRKKMESQLLHASLHDSLTDLPNRALLLDRLHRVIAHGSRSKEYPFALLYLDLDRFKDINDTLGHVVGDKLLVGIADRLRSALREFDTVARIGGDEFAIILEEIHTHEILENLCERILGIINKPIEIEGKEISISSSMGVVSGNPLYLDPEEYLKDADIAMYQAKERGKARYEIFDISMRTSVFNRMKIENLLCQACYESEFSVAYQPIFNLENNDMVGFEALLRWNQPEIGVISPSEFIPIAENTGMICGIGTWVLKKVCVQMDAWDTFIKQLPNFKININISAVQLLRKDFPDELESILSRKNIDPDLLAIEITETAFIKNPMLASEQVEKIKSIGVEIQLDDFGTGFSSLSFINLFQVDVIKIERQFIATLDQERQAALVRAIIAMGKNLGLEIIAEGIETQEQLNFVLNGGCKLGQGFYFSDAIGPQVAQEMLLSQINKNEIQALPLSKVLVR